MRLGWGHRVWQAPQLTGCPEWWGWEIRTGPTGWVSGVAQPSLALGRATCAFETVCAQMGSTAWLFDLFEAGELGSGLADRQRAASCPRAAVGPWPDPQAHWGGKAVAPGRLRAGRQCPQALHPVRATDLEWLGRLVSYISWWFCFFHVFSHFILKVGSLAGSFPEGFN